MNKGIIYALVASIIWGIDYALADRVLKNISVITLIAFEMLIGSIFFICLGYNEIKVDALLLKERSDILSIFLLDTIGFNIGFYCICKSIQTSNATVAGLIEICYPLFIILASWLFFRENHLSWAVIVGGLLIFSGIIIISVFNK